MEKPVPLGPWQLDSAWSSENSDASFCPVCGLTKNRKKFGIGFFSKFLLENASADVEHVKLPNMLPYFFGCFFGNLQIPGNVRRQSGIGEFLLLMSMSVNTRFFFKNPQILPNVRRQRGFGEFLVCWFAGVLTWGFFVKSSDSMKCEQIDGN